jgi:hypothetical protein
MGRIQGFSSIIIFINEVLWAGRGFNCEFRVFVGWFGITVVVSLSKRGAVWA